MTETNFFHQKQFLLDVLEKAISSRDGTDNFAWIIKTVVTANLQGDLKKLQVGPAWQKFLNEIYEVYPADTVRKFIKGDPEDIGNNLFSQWGRSKTTAHHRIALSAYYIFHTSSDDKRLRSATEIDLQLFGVPFKEAFGVSVPTTEEEAVNLDKLLLSQLVETKPITEIRRGYHIQKIPRQHITVDSVSPWEVCLNRLGVYDGMKVFSGGHRSSLSIGMPSNGVPISANTLRLNEEYRFEIEGFASGAYYIAVFEYYGSNWHIMPLTNEAHSIKCSETKLSVPVFDEKNRFSYWVESEDSGTHRFVSLITRSNWLNNIDFEGGCLNNSFLDALAQKSIDNYEHSLIRCLNLRFLDE
ncbi:MAG: hypothetical protein ABJO52_20935 [Nisaea sp.]|uniref:hypothetical protein n=1 Tax=Nisaea sp. TaxID=2024842 RepID=UPI003298492F